MLGYQKTLSSFEYFLPVHHDKEFDLLTSQILHYLWIHLYNPYDWTLQLQGYNQEYLLVFQLILAFWMALNHHPCYFQIQFFHLISSVQSCLYRLLVESIFWYHHYHSVMDMYWVHLIVEYWTSRLIQLTLIHRSVHGMRDNYLLGKIVIDNCLLLVWSKIILGHHIRSNQQCFPFSFPAYCLLRPCW